jgi:hypothetical protein
MERPGVLSVLEVDELETEDREDREGEEFKPRVDGPAAADDEDDLDELNWR